jgi:hypothetical protein
LPDPLHVGIAECSGVEYRISVVDTAKRTRLGTGVAVEYRVSVVNIAELMRLDTGVIESASVKRDVGISEVGGNHGVRFGDIMFTSCGSGPQP